MGVEERGEWESGENERSIEMSDRIHSHRDLVVYQKSFSAGRRVFELSQVFPRDEMYSLTDQLRRSSRSVSANHCRAWRKRRYRNTVQHSNILADHCG